MAANPQSTGIPGAPFESVTFNDDLRVRPRRAADHEAELRALSVLVQALADSPETILQALVEQMLALFNAGSAGISLLTTRDGEERFYWPAVAGQWSCFIGGGTPRNFGPCGDVLDHNKAFLFRDLESRYDYFASALPRVEECLLVPFYLAGTAVGTIWIVAHDKTRQFDSEDLRQMESIARFAATAYRTVQLLQDLQQKTHRLEATETMLRHRLSDLEATSAKLSAANAELNQFAYAASHDLHEPLRAIKVYSELLFRSTRVPEEQRWADFVIDGCSRMDALITDLLAYAKSGDYNRNLHEVVDLHAVFESAIHNLKTAIEESHAVVTHDALPVVHGHAEHFLQLIQNLLSNAIKYRSEETPCIHLSAKRENEQWHLVVSDNGAGIAPEHHQFVFDAFRRLHGKDISGTGLGLAICRRIVEQTGGKIWIESDLGAGAKFHFTLRIDEKQSAADETSPVVDLSDGKQALAPTVASEPGN
ncbi:MAG TPA: ATP-binding protein [Bryobacteraceae bacterium]